MVDIILLGAPGAGKGTQAELVQRWLPLPQVSSGDLFRSNIGQGTELGLKAKAYMDRGELVPDDVTIGMVADRLAQEDCADGVILDGFPRTVAQAEALNGILAEMGRRVDIVVDIDVSKEILLKRLGGRWTCRSCGRVYHELFSPEKVKGVCDACGGELYQRADDTPDTQRRRIQVYLDQTAPLKAYYQEKGLVAEVDGEQEIDQVQAEIERAIKAVMS
jgi:adenylate kinase